MREFSLDTVAGKTAIQKLMMQAQFPSLFSQGDIFGRLQVEQGGQEGTPAQSAKVAESVRVNDGSEPHIHITMRQELPGLKYCQVGPLFLTGCEWASSSAKSPTGINKNVATVPRMSRNSLST